MKTRNKVNLMLEAIESANKEDLINVVTGLSSGEIKEMSQIISQIRSVISSGTGSVHILPPTTPGSSFELEIVHTIISDEEQKET